MLEAAYANGGSLLKFGGDALLLFFDGDEHAERACRAAALMRAALRTAGRIETPGARVTLRMSVGIHSDALHLFLVGDSHLEPVVCGPAGSAALRMERAARAGDIVVSPQTAALLPARALGAPAGRRPAPAQRARRRGGRRRTTIAGRTAARSRGRCVSTALRAHLGEGEQPPEHRIVTIAFLRFGGTDSLIRRHGTAAAAEALDELVSDVQRAADDHEVAFLGSDVDVDGGKLLLCAGAPRVAGDDEERMLATLRRIVEGRRRLPVRAGVNRGLAFTGDVGPPYRRTYTAMGDVVNVAARLMARAPVGEIYATPGVLDRSRDPLRDRRARAARAQGQGPAAPGGERRAARSAPARRTRPPRGACRSSDGRTSSRCSPTRCWPRGAARAASSRWPGDPGIGKTRLLEEVRRRADGVRTLHATCEAYTASAPYSVWRELLVAAARPRLGRRRRDRPRPPAGGGRGARARAGASGSRCSPSRSGCACPRRPRWRA